MSGPTAVEELESLDKVVLDDLGFDAKEYQKFLSNRSTLSNDVAREDPETSIFDAMVAASDELDKKIYGGQSINDIFRNLR